MRAYYFDDADSDCRQAHDSGEAVSAEHLAGLGVLYRHFAPPQDNASQEKLDALAAQRAYSHRDEITVSPQAMGDAYEGKIHMFFAEHMHEDEEIRYILDGAGYFDVREQGDARWVRVRLEPGDLLVLPAGIYHRFTVDTDNYIKAMRLFKEEPKWTPLNRGTDTDANPLRKDYVASRQAGFAQAA